MRISPNLLALALLSTAPYAQTLLGPTPYLSRSDSPFTDCVAYEDFEDHVFDLPGVSADTGIVTSVGNPGSSLYDSVDADDGAIDGDSGSGDSYFASPPVITFSFDPVALGGYPTRAGLVWVDGAGTTTFEAFDASGVSLGTIGPVSLADGSFTGGTAEDHFFGVTHAGGISAIRISGTSGGIEVDHIQYGFAVGASVQATETVRLGVPPNPNVFRPSRTTPPILGAPWTPYIDHTNFATGAALDFIVIDTGPPINVPVKFGTQLCKVPPPGQVFFVPAGNPFALKLPNDCSFAGLSACAQAGSFTAGGPVELANALDIVVGTY